MTVPPCFAAVRPQVRPSPWVSLAIVLAPVLVAARGSQDGAPPATDVTPSATPANERVLELTLEDARRLALATNVDLEIVDLTTDVARYIARGSWGAFDPLINASLRYEDSETQPLLAFQEPGEAQRWIATAGLGVPLKTGGRFDVGYATENIEADGGNLPPEATSDALSLGFTQPLLRGFGYDAATANQREAEFAARRQEELLRQRREDLLLDVENAYWDLVAALDQLEVRESSVALFSRQAEEESERLRVGVGTEVDLLQAETNLAVERERELLARTDVEARRDDLKRLIFRRDATAGGPEDERPGWDTFLEIWDAPLVPLTPLPEPSVDRPAPAWQASLAVAYDHRAEMAQALWEIEARRASLDLAESLRRPGLDLVLDVRSVAVSEDATETFESVWGFDSPTYGIGLNFNFPIGNRSAAYQERAARAELRRAQLELERVETQVLAEVRAGTRDVAYRREAVEAARLSRELAERQLQSEEVRYQEGLSTTFQLLQFQQDLATASSNERAALANHAKAQAALLRAEGRLEQGALR